MKVGGRMKKIFCLVAFFALVITMASCSSDKIENPIDFGKKYMLDEDNYYVFEDDQTGYHERYYKYERSEYYESNYTLSYRIEFVWREASNGAVYLFETKTTYKEDHTDGKKASLIEEPIYFSDEFFTYTYGTAGGNFIKNYVKEGSELEKILEKD